MSDKNIRKLNANAFQIKMFMAILMVFDHVPHIPGLVSPLWIGIFHAITRCVGVWFAFNAVEGFLHTRSQVRYNLRLFGWAAFMQIGNCILEVVLKSKDIHITNNIFLTLAMGVLVLNILADPKQLFARKNNKFIKALQIILAVIVGVVGFIFTEGGVVVIPFILITYLLRESPKKRNIVYIIYAAILAVMNLNGALHYDNSMMNLEMILYNSDWLFITVLPFIYLYNGQRGKNNKFTKYFFYVFYPAHLWIIAIISYFFK